MSEPLKIFYDGGCKVCSWEVKKYLAMDSRKVLGTIDINSPSFRAEDFGLDRNEVRKYFHVLTPKNRVISGVDAFIEIWKALDRPISRNAAKLAKFPPVHAALRLGYSVFVVVRPYLPRNAVECDDGSCEIK
jgi:predicted DCC family thiol-disulfide oxidoreductase YuxK